MTETRKSFHESTLIFNRLMLSEILKTNFSKCRIRTSAVKPQKILCDRKFNFDTRRLHKHL